MTFAATAQNQKRTKVDPPKRPAKPQKPEAPKVPDPPARKSVTVDGVKEISLSDITFDGTNYPIDEITKESVAELASSIKSIGLQQPIVVYRKSEMPPGIPKPRGDAKYIVACGHRRVVALRSIGETKVSASIVHIFDAADLDEIRAVENFHRRDPDPIDEAVLIAKMLDRYEDHPRRFDLVGERIGKSAAWVRDRSYLALLSGASRDAVKRGLLGLGQAKVIARLADPRLRDQCAEYAMRRDDGSGGWSVEQVERWVANNLNSLRVVRWKLDVKFGGLPACTTCPHNSANDKRLFGQADSDDSMVCGKPSCFNKKTEITDRAITDVVKSKDVKKLESVTEGAIAPIAPSHIKVSSLVGAAKRARAGSEGSGAPSGSGKTAKQAEPPRETVEEEAKRLMQNENAGIDRDCFQGIRTAIKDRPVATAMLTAAMAFIDEGDVGEKKNTAFNRAGFVAFLKQIVDLDGPDADLAKVRKVGECLLSLAKRHDVDDDPFRWNGLLSRVGITQHNSVMRDREIVELVSDVFGYEKPKYLDLKECVRLVKEARADEAKKAKEPKK